MRQLTIELFRRLLLCRQQIDLSVLRETVLMRNGAEKFVLARVAGRFGRSRVVQPAARWSVCERAFSATGNEAVTEVRSSSAEDQEEEEFGDLLRAAAAYYSARLREKGEGAEGMDWRGRDSQLLRFERLLAHFDRGVSGSLLDVGCGSGELLGYCRSRGWWPEYLGIDVSEEMVTACQRRFGADSAARTTLGELIRQGRRFDLVVASGTFNVRQAASEERWRRYFHRSVSEMFALARWGAAFNIMSSRVDYRRDHLYYARVEEMARLADACGTRQFVVDHGYSLFEMTVTLFSTNTE